LQERGVNAIFLEVRINNAPAQSLYQDCGFYVLGLRRRYYPDGSDALAMVKRMDLE
jgi:ribosomal-protein-alanine N-acetyltransferase